MTYGWHTSTYEWHTDDIRVHTSDIQMSYEDIRVTYGLYTSIYEWHTDDIQVDTSDIRMTCYTNNIRVSHGWHAVPKKNKVIFFKAFWKFWKFSFKISDLQKNSLHVMVVLDCLIKLNRDLELTLGANFLHVFFIQMFLI